MTTVQSEPEADILRQTERERRRALVDANMEVAGRLHADDFQLIASFTLFAGSTLRRRQFGQRVQSIVVPREAP